MQPRSECSRRRRDEQDAEDAERGRPHLAIQAKGFNGARAQQECRRAPTTMASAVETGILRAIMAAAQEEAAEKNRAAHLEIMQAKEARLAQEVADLKSQLSSRRACSKCG